MHPTAENKIVSRPLIIDRWGTDSSAYSAIIASFESYQGVAMAPAIVISTLVRTAPNHRSDLTHSDAFVGEGGALYLFLLLLRLIEARNIAGAQAQTQLMANGFAYVAACALIESATTDCGTAT